MTSLYMQFRFVNLSSNGTELYYLLSYLLLFSDHKVFVFNNMNRTCDFNTMPSLILLKNYSKHDLMPILIDIISSQQPLPPRLPGLVPRARATSCRAGWLPSPR